MLVFIVCIVLSGFVTALANDPNWAEVGEGEWPTGIKSHPPSEPAINWSVVNPLPFDANMIGPEARWILNEPNFFSTYKRFEKEDYFQLICRNWLRYNPLQCYKIPISGRKTRVYYRMENPVEIGNCAFWDRVDLRSFAVYAKKYQGKLLFSPKQKSITITNFEIMAKFMELFFMKE